MKKDSKKTADQRTEVESVQMTENNNKRKMKYDMDEKLQGGECVHEKKIQ